MKQYFWCLAVSFIMFYRPTVDTHGYSFLLISVELNSSYIFVFVVMEIELGISQLLSKHSTPSSGCIIRGYHCTMFIWPPADSSVGTS